MMTDESPREERPVPAPPAPLRREVEPPRAASGLWLPFMALASAAMLTIVSGIAVMTRAPRAMVVESAEMKPTETLRVDTEQMRREIDRVRARQNELEHQRRVMCRAPVHRG